MFCPSCGSEERQLSQFCRLCGTDLRAVRAGMERPDAIESSAVTAREEIGRAIAAKIKELRGPGELKTMAEDVLPKIEEFLESPEEKRLRRMRSGVIISSIGLGVMLMFMMAALVTAKGEFLLFGIPGIIAFIIGLGIIINGKLLTAQSRQHADHSRELGQKNLLDQLPSGAASTQRELQAAQNPPGSVIEHTTHRLGSETVVSQRRRAELSDES